MTVAVPASAEAVETGSVPPGIMLSASSSAGPVGSPAASLRRRLENGPVVAGSCWDAFSARLHETAGFEVLHLSGANFECTQLGAPDLGLTTLTELAVAVRRITDATSAPLIVDVDTGFGGVLNVQRTIREMVHAGAAGVHLEDQATPKRSPLLRGRTVLSRSDSLERIAAAKEASGAEDLFLIARTDGDVISYEELVCRANAYARAGADAVMPMLVECDDGSWFDSLEPHVQMDWHRSLTADVDCPHIVGPYPPAGYTTGDMIEAGYSIVAYGSPSVLAMADAVLTACRELLRDGRATTFERSGAATGHAGFRELATLVGLEGYLDIERRFTDVGS